MSSVLAAFGLSLVAALLLTPVARRLALRIGCLDPVKDRGVHTEPKPYLGGLAIYAAFTVAVLVAVRPLDRGFAGILLVGTLIMLIGLIDDLRRPRGIPARYKFILQALAAALLVYGFDVRINWIKNPFTPYIPNDYLFFGAWAGPLSILWLVSFTNIINLVDGLDGLAAGISGIASLTLFLVSLQQGDVQLMVLPAALAGAAIGFLKYNFNPAKIFMGDAGALFLGFALGGIAIHGVLKSAATVGVAVPILAVGLPVLDTALAILRRVASGRSIGEADRDHLHHRLMRLGLSHRDTVLVLWAVSASLGLAAVAITEMAPPGAVLLMGAILTTILYGLHKVGALQVAPNRRRNLHR